MNNKATLGEQTMVVLFLLNLFLIMAGIVWGVYAFFTQDYEFREADSALLTFHIKDCLIENNIPFENESQFAADFYKVCRLNKKVIEENFLVYIKFTDKEFRAGIADLTQCALSEKNENFPKCTNTTIEEKNIFIQTGSNQKSKRIKTI